LFSIKRKYCCKVVFGAAKGHSLWESVYFNKINKTDLNTADSTYRQIVTSFKMSISDTDWETALLTITFLST